MTTPEPVEIEYFVIEMKALVPTFDAQIPWLRIGGPYEMDEAERKFNWLLEKHPEREYRIVKAV